MAAAHRGACCCGRYFARPVYDFALDRGRPGDRCGRRQARAPRCSPGAAQGRGGPCPRPGRPDRGLPERAAPRPGRAAGRARCPAPMPTLRSTRTAAGPPAREPALPAARLRAQARGTGERHPARRRRDRRLSRAADPRAARRGQHRPLSAAQVGRRGGPPSARHRRRRPRRHAGADGRRQLPGLQRSTRDLAWHALQRGYAVWLPTFVH